MKKNLLLLAFLFVTTPLASNAQFIRGYGLKVGSVSAAQNWDYKLNFDFPTDRRWGLDLGGFVEIFDTPVFSVLAEAHYVQKGFSFTIPITSPTQPDITGQYITKKPRVDYFSIPLLTKLRMDVATISPYVFGGPRLDILIGTKPEGTDVVLNNFKSTDVGVTLGAGVEVALLPGIAALIEVRYSPNLTAAFSNDNLSVKNQSIEMFVGVRL